MSILLDKSVLFILCFVTYLQHNRGTYLVVPVIVALVASALNSYWDRASVKLAVFAALCLTSLVYPLLLFFLPLIAYDVFTTRVQWLAAFALLPLMVHFHDLSADSVISIAIFMALPFLLVRRTSAMQKLRFEYVQLRDSTKEFSIHLQDKNKELLEKQDYEINLATLNERQRIARDIHDNIGHLLTNSILQTGAMLAVCNDEALKERLLVLKQTLGAGMDSIRESIHDLHDESIDLYSEVKKLVDGFTFCEVFLEYDVDGNPERPIKYALLAVLKEGLANIGKHSNATSATITIREHPALYQLIIRDNGTKKSKGTEGIGLLNIEQRVSALNGIFRVSAEDGFTLFVSLPKGEYR